MLLTVLVDKHYQFSLFELVVYSHRTEVPVLVVRAIEESLPNIRFNSQALLP